MGTASELNTLRAMLLARAQPPAGDRLAVIDGSDRVSFGELAARAGERAAALRERGVQPGDLVALRMSAGLAFVETWWALQLIGAVPAAFNPAVPAASFERHARALGDVPVITDEDAPRLRRRGASVPEVDVSPDGLALLQPTSGTSGSPRLVMITQRNIVAMLHATRDHVAADDVMVAWVPPWHDLGLFRFVIGVVYYGAVCHIVEPAVRTIPEWFRTISQVGATVTAGPDFAFRIAPRMIPAGSVDLSSLSFATSGGEPVRRSTIERFEDHFDVPGVVQPAYGLAEATVGVTTVLPGEPLVADERGTVSCGRPLPGFEVRAGRSHDEPGEILVQSDTVFLGYLGAPEETSRALRGGWLHTGDSGYVDAEGRLFVLGRRSGMIKRAGGMVAPRELEEAAQMVPEVRVAAAVGLGAPDSAGDDSIAVLVEADESSGRSGDDVAVDVSARILAQVGFAPNRVMILPPRSIPRTANGKISHDRARAALQSEAFS